MKSFYLYGFVGIGGPKVKFFEILPRVWLYKVPNHQFKCCEVVLDGLHVGFLRYYGMEKLYEEKWYQKMQNQHFWAKPRGGTGTTIQNPFGTGTNTSGTSTTIKNVFGTGTTVSKSPDFCHFVYLSPNSYTVSMGTLLND